MSSEDWDMDNSVEIRLNQEADVYGFAELMNRELQNNAVKGSFTDWEPTKRELLAEIDHHLNKFKVALSADDHDKITEYAADIANFCMKAHEQYGEDSFEEDEHYYL